jgi:hypothetical protein
MWPNAAGGADSVNLQDVPWRNACAAGEADDAICETCLPTLAGRAA